MDGVIPTPAEQRNSSLSSIDPATRWAQYRKHGGGTGHHHYILCLVNMVYLYINGLSCMYTSKRWGGYLISAKKTMERPFLESAMMPLPRHTLRLLHIAKKEGALRVLLQAVTKDFSSSSSSCLEQSTSLRRGTQFKSCCASSA